MLPKRTYRYVDGERIDGTWRLVFVQMGPGYFLWDLEIYADGAIRCLEWMDLDGLRDKVMSGHIATTLRHGARASAAGLGSWHLGNPDMSIYPWDLVAEVADYIEQLNGRPDSIGRCLLAVRRFLQTRSEADRLALSAIYQAIPRHLRSNALRDPLYRDAPLRILCSDMGSPATGGNTIAELEAEPPEGQPTVVTEDARQWAVDYFIEHLDDLLTRQQTYDDEDGPLREPHADDPDIEPRTLRLSTPRLPRGNAVFRHDYPAPITVGSVEYPSVAHAYWALSTTDEAARDRIRATERPEKAEEIAAQAPRRADWPQVRLAVMADLVRAKFTQYPDLADLLIATGDARIHHGQFGSDYWHADSSRGRNWAGRLLELVRAELLAARAGIRTSERS
ncbi:NADAR family protein [Acrocarpospora catenulata]|uniref:NADAR family protein n=1 Tax=Acrocarpospora catenulata TaxID=2836182 RepID=UPI001BDA5D23|nr:NADAR family protein [Acrocarpospora catenulata]